MAKISNPVLTSAEFVVQGSKEVRINAEAVDRAARQLTEARKQGAFALANWKLSPLNPKSMDLAALEWIFLIDTLNFSFFSDDDSRPYTVEYDGKGWTGYWSLCAAVNRAIKEGVPITKASFLRTISMERVEHIFRSSNGTQVPLLAERQRVLQEAGEVLETKFGGSLVNCINQADKSALKLLNLVVSSFSSYNDECSFHGTQVQFHKRAQILISDIWACFEGKSYGEFTDIDCLTMFADYRVPQGLVYLGVMEYSDSLLKKLNERTPIPRGDEVECEIRAASIWSVELIARKMRELEEGSEPLNSIVIDFYLWEFAKKYTEEMKRIPIHRTRSIFY